MVPIAFFREMSSIFRKRERESHSLHPFFHPHRMCVKIKFQVIGRKTSGLQDFYDFLFHIYQVDLIRKHPNLRYGFCQHFLNPFKVLKSYFSIVHIQDLEKPRIVMHIPNMIRAWEMERSRFFLASLPLNTPHQGDQSHDHKVKSFVFFQFSLIFFKRIMVIKNNIQSYRKRV